VGTIAASKFSEALKLNSSLTELNMSGNRIVASHRSLNTENEIGDEAVIKLSEALKSNSSLVTLELYGNRLVVSF
jgi:hypothetical protein